MKKSITRTTDCLKDHLLLATPLIEFGIFKRSVTYVCEHGESGAMGLVINQPLDLELADIFEHLHITENSLVGKTPVLAGGPIKVDHGFVLHRGNSSWESTLLITDEIKLSTSLDVLQAIASNSGPGQFLIALGYAGWAAGQLEKELAENSWLAVRCDPKILFETECDKRLGSAGALLGINIDLMSSAMGHG